MVDVVKQSNSNYYNVHLIKKWSTKSPNESFTKTYYENYLASIYEFVV